MRCTPFLASLVVLLAIASESVAVEKHVVAFRDDGTVIRVPLPETPQTPPPVAPAWQILDSSFHVLGSDRDENGRILVLSPTDQLIEYSPSTGQQTSICNLGLTLGSEMDLAFGPGDRPILATTGSAHSKTLFDVDTDGCELTPLPPATEYFETMTYHQGDFYGGSSNFVRIDPLTFETTVVRDVNPHGNTRITGLSSDGDKLWYLLSFDTFLWTVHSSVGTIDPSTGEMTSYMTLPGSNVSYEAFEVILQEVPIPALNPVGIAILLIVISAAGVVALRHQ